MNDSDIIKATEQKIEEICACETPANAENIRRAYRYARSLHEGQYRKSGEPYIIHPVETAYILSQLGMDPEAIEAGLLHDCIEDTCVTYNDIKKEFGDSVALLVDGVTKLGHIVYSSREEEQMEDLRKMFLAMAKDIRVIIIKLADRLHNMRTNQYWNPRKRSEKALETMEIYAPLAHRLGMQTIKKELEDISLQILDPVGCDEITSFLAGKKVKLHEFLQSIENTIAQRLRAEGIEFEIKSRVKHLYSIYRKVYGQNLNFDEIYDICATRVIVEDIHDCYNVLGVIHELFRLVPGRFKDYISTPKPNGYQSLHTSVIGNDGVPIEVQIRTKQMDQMAEYGIAAHWKYKDGLRGQQNEEAFAWVRQLLESQQDSDAEDFIKNIKVDMFSDEVFVFTPKGDVISLPNGATPIDFAYAIHSQVGNRMTGAKVNGRIVTIDYALKNGDVVDIITSSSSTGPKRDWMQIVKTSSARTKMKQWFKKERREENIETGRAELERELKIGLLWDTFNQKDFQTVLLRRFDFPSLDELYASIGYGGIAMSRIIARVREEHTKQQKQRENPAAQIMKSDKNRKPSNSGVIVEGLDNCLVKFSKCCCPIPGDDIIGFVTRGYGVSVHRKDCGNVRTSLNKDSEYGRWIKAEWDDNADRKNYSVALRITAKTRTGVLADIVTVISNMKIGVTELNARDTADGQTNIFLTALVSGREQLSLLMQRIRKSTGVYDITRCIEGKEEN
ncbi:MAG: bifunctional (p)ppGpp synthetase/guanosine-3',5'-bis(diphosphate) 3'-pyrophosphohydrolase [Clostridia bacterium]|nr:bifunctional (p)ppGpp synthetase/guanosine-3',5'-bis(diphosphate) 3'-pyrophosphohydrolase [Clostridia bacterium]